MNIVQSCSNKQHSQPRIGSPYPKDSVPISLFYKNPNNSNSQKYKTCFHCRNQTKNSAQRRRNEKKQKEEEQKEEKIRQQKEELEKIEIETKECSNKYHNNPSTKSPYDQRYVPKNMFYKDPDNPTGQEYKYCNLCREVKQKSSKKVKAEKRKIAEEIKTINSEFSVCLNTEHRSFYKYPWDKVPKLCFLENPENPNSKVFKTCRECREAALEKAKECREEVYKIREEIGENSKFWVCIHRDHDTRSKYPRDGVPREMFMKDPKDPKSILYEQCSDCRERHMNASHSIRDRIRETLLESEFFCEGCKKAQSIEIRAKNLDGSDSSSCLNCKRKGIERRKEVSEFRLKMKEEQIKKNGCSCEVCGNIYLLPERGTEYAVELSTYEENGTRYVKYQGEIYETSIFLDKFQHLLELRVLHFDHLTEEEQRERGILGENDVYIGKRANVTNMGCESSMLREMEKTQLICARCHVKETVRRQKGTERGGFRKQKMDYVNKVREKGCSVCGFYDPDLLKFLDFDHIDPDNKVMNVSKMVVDPECSIEDLIRECDGSVTRVICKHCHAIHTAEQQGWLYNLYLD